MKYAAAMGASFLLLVGLGLGSNDARAAQHGVGIQASHFSPGDDETEARFNIDSGPIPQVYYRFQTKAHNVFVGIGLAGWESNGVFETSSLDFGVIAANYRYLPWHDNVVSLVVGGGLGWVIYDAQISSAFTLEDQSGLVLAVEPLVGVEFRAHRSVRVGLDVKYSKQLFSTDDFEEFAGFTNVDLSGIHASLSVSFMFGN